MRILHAAKPIVGLAAAISILAACSGGSQSALAPSSGGASDAARTVVHTAALSKVSPVTNPDFGKNVNIDHGKSWSRVGANNASALLYVTNINTADVTFYTYNNGAPTPTPVGTLTGFAYPAQPCVDHAGNVYIPDYALETVSVYAHGATTPTRVLPAVFPTGCSVDSNGNLAVANFSAGSVSVYTGGMGTPTVYTDSNQAYAEYVAYDNNHNLFINGRDGSLNYHLSELKSGAGSITDLSLSGGSVAFPGQIQWGGTYLLVGDQGSYQVTPSYVNQVTVSGTTATFHSQKALTGTHDVTGYWKRGGKHGAKLVAADESPNVGTGEGSVPVYNWPAATLFGTPLTMGVDNPFGTTISP